MITLKKVETLEEATICNQLLTLLIASECQYDSNIKPDFTVTNFYDVYYKDENYFLVFALDGKIPVGFISAYLKDKAGKLTIESTGFISGLYVKAEYRNQGIATQLLEEFYRWCKEKEIKKVDIRVYLENESAKKLYMKHGFQTCILHMTKNLE